MIRLLMWGLLLYIGFRIVKSLTAPKPGAGQSSRPAETGETTHQDPVCGIYVSEKNAVIGRHDGQRHYFCSMNCLEKFRENLDQIQQ